MYVLTKQVLYCRFILDKNGKKEILNFIEFYELIGLLTYICTLYSNVFCIIHEFFSRLNINVVKHFFNTWHCVQE